MQEYHVISYYVINYTKIYKDTLIILSSFNFKIKNINMIHNTKNYTRIMFSNYNNFECAIKKFHTNSYQNNFTYMPSYFDKSLKKLNPKLTNLILGDYFNQSIDNLSSNKTIKYLEFGNKFNKYVNNLPYLLTELIFGDDFNQIVDNLPCSIIRLIFGYKFNQFVDNLPCSLTHLIFCDKFNQFVDNLPLLIIYLKFGCNFNKPIDNLPQSIIHLVLGQNFNQLVDNLPSSIIYLYFNCLGDFNNSINNLPCTIMYIKLPKTYYTVEKLYPNLKYIKCSKNTHFIKHKYYLDKNVNFEYIDLSIKYI